MSSSRKTILNELNNLETALFSTIRNLNRTEIKGFMEDEFGYLDSGEFGYKLKAKIDLSFGGVLKNAGIAIKRLTEKIVLQLDATDEYLDAIPEWLLEGGGKAATVLGQTPIGDLKSIIFKSRDMLSTITSAPIKFHPWGVTNMAKTISSNAGNAVGVLSVLSDGYDLYKQAKDEEETENIKKEITGRIKEIFRPLYEILSEEDRFLKGFAPQITECEVIVTQQKLALDEIKKRRNQLEVIQKRLIEYKSEKI